MNVTCSAEPCPVILNSTCVFYEGATLYYTGINNNDNLQTALQKIDAKFEDAGLGYIFTNGVIQSSPGLPVKLGGSLIENTTITNSGFWIKFTETVEASTFITTGGTSSEFVKGDGSLDGNSYQLVGNYITALTGDGTASGPGSAVLTLSNTGVIANTYGSSSQVPAITVDAKGRITNVTNTAINYPAQLLLFSGDAYGAGHTGANVTLTLNTVNSNVYGSNTFLKFAVNGKGLVTSAAPINGSDINSALGYIPVPTTRTITINGVTQDLSANRSWVVSGGGGGSAFWGGITGTVTNQTDLISYLSLTYYPLSGNPLGFISSAIANATYYPLTNPSNYISLANLSAGTGINYNNLTGEITNSAPDQVVTLTNGSNVTITGTYPNFTISATGGGSGSVTSVFSRTGVVTAQSGDYTTDLVTEGTNLYFTNARARSAISLTTTGTSGVATYSSLTGVLNIPNYTTALSGYVPYTGATQNVDLGEYGISSGYFQADLTPTQTSGVGRLTWNSTDGTLDLGLLGGNVTLQIGQEQVVRVVNKTGANLLEANYNAVKIDGAQGNRLKIALAQANNDSNSADTLGLVTENINNNQEGFVTTSGLVRSINTTGSLQGETWADGDMLFLSGTTAGAITNVKPVAPTHLVILGYVVRAHVTQGQIFVKVNNGYELEELHDVLPTPYINDGVLYRDTTANLWKSATIPTVLGYTPASLDSPSFSNTIEVLGTSVAPYTKYANTLANFVANVNDYQLVYVQNVNGGSDASADFVAYNDVSDIDSYFIDMGINSSNYSSTLYPIFPANSGYVFTGGGTGIQPSHLYMGTSTANSDVVLFAGGVTTSDIKATIKADTGNFLLGTTLDDTIHKLQVAGSSSFTGDVNVVGGVYADADILGDPHQLVTKEYVDNQSSAGLHIHTPVRVENSASLTATYTQGGTTPTITQITSNSILTSVGHSLLENDMIVFNVTSNGITAGLTYFVFQVLSADTFTISATITGPAITTLTNGSGLTITSRANSGVGATLTNAGTQAALVIDGVTLVASDRVLIYNQSIGYFNGVYTVTNVGSPSTNWVLTRSSDTNKYETQSPNSIGGGDYFFVQEGSTGAGESYVVTNTGDFIIGTDTIVFTQFSASPTYSGIAPIDVTGQNISLTGIVDATHGGTGVGTVTTGDLLYGSATDTWNKLSLGIAYKSLMVNATGTQIEWNAVPLNQTAAVSGELGVVNGGTGVNTLTGIPVASGTSAFTAITGSANQLLRRNAGNTAYEFFTPTYITLSSLSATSPLIYNSGTGGFTIQSANASQNGYLTSADWSTFNGKQPALSGTGFVKISGTTISYDNSTYITGNQSISFAPTGDVTGSASGTTSLTPTLSIGANKVTNAMLAQVATGTFHGRVTAATGNVETLTGTQATTLLDTFTSSLKGLAPASGGGTTTFLRADGTWATPAGGGSSMTWTVVTGTSQTASSNNGYITNNIALVTVTLPTTSAVGDIIELVAKGDGGWKIAQPNVNSIIKFGKAQSTLGTTGYLQSTATNDTIRILCTTSNAEWIVLSSVGNITLA